MKQIGFTTDGRPVVDGVFAMYAVHGMPLSFVFDRCRDLGLQACWQTFYVDATDNGWSHETIIARLSEALADSVGTAYRDVVIARLNAAYEATPR